MNKFDLELQAEAAVASTDTSDNKIQQFCLLWGGAIEPVLELVKNITGRKIDEKIDQLSEAADNVCSGDSAQIAKFCTLWESLQIRAMLRAVQMFTGPKVDKSINRFIDLADDLCG